MLKEVHSGWRKDGRKSWKAVPTSLGSQGRKVTLFEGHQEASKGSKQEGSWLVSCCV